MRFREHTNGSAPQPPYSVFSASDLPTEKAAAVSDVLDELVLKHNLPDHGAGWGTCYTGLSEAVTEGFVPEAPSCGRTCRRSIEVTATDTYAAECYVSVACPSSNGNGSGEGIPPCLEHHQAIFAAFGDWAVRQTTASSDSESIA